MAFINASDRIPISPGPKGRRQPKTAQEKAAAEQRRQRRVEARHVKKRKRHLRRQGELMLKRFLQHPIIKVDAPLTPPIDPTRHRRGFLHVDALRQRCPYLKDQDGKISIYALVNCEGYAHYVGISRQPSKRLSQHLRRPVNRKVAAWLGDLRRRYEEPQVLILGTTNEACWEETEIRVIAWCRRFGRLLNVDPGGLYRDDNGRPLPSARERVRRIRKEIGHLAREVP